jgi:hypothetical protein
MRRRHARCHAGLAGLQHIEAAEKDKQQHDQRRNAGLAGHHQEAQLHQGDQAHGRQKHRTQVALALQREERGAHDDE